ncbi:MAG: sugar phosphate isomerase/epimerase [Spirochaetia bacterium]|nr:sugar phosphate isomerase/epimerase [Spirochaetia bacterium]
MAFKLSAITWSQHHSFDLKKVDEFKLMDLYASAGLGGIEFINEHLSSLEPAHLRKIKKYATDRNLTITCLSPGNNFGNEDDKAQASNEEYVTRSIDAAEILGAPVVRVFAGWPPQGKREQLWAKAVASMKKCAAYAATKGITLVLEPHNGGGFLPDSTSTVKFLEDVGSDYLKLNVDTGNYHEKDIPGAIKNTMKYTSYVHFKIHTISKNGKKTSDFDLPKTMKVLAESGYNGFLAIEYEGQDFLKTEDKEAKAANEAEFFPVAVKRVKELIKKYY